MAQAVPRDGRSDKGVAVLPLGHERAVLAAMLSGGLRGIRAWMFVSAGAAAVGCIRVKSAEDPEVTQEADAATDGGIALPPSDGGGAATDGPVGKNGCPSGGGPDMVNVGPFCIDSSEVTIAQYLTFLASKAGDTRGQPAYCAGNTTYTPSQGWPAKAADEQKPVTAIEWCDAYAFCKWAGKRLCQAPSGGTDEWHYACSHKDDGLHAFPYGNTYSPTACNGVERGGQLVPVKSLASCQADPSGFAGIFDMSGNVWEYVDDCKLADGGPGANDQCGVSGGGAGQTGGDLACARRDHRPRGSFSNTDVGFRCCASP